MKTQQELETISLFIPLLRGVCAGNCGPAGCVKADGEHIVVVEKRQPSESELVNTLEKTNNKNEQQTVAISSANPLSAFFPGQSSYHVGKSLTTAFTAVKKDQQTLTNSKEDQPQEQILASNICG